MAGTPQRVPDALRARIGEDLSVTWWLRPHHAWGWIKNIMVLNEEDDESVIVVGSSQSFSVFSGTMAREEIDPDLPNTEHHVGHAFLQALLETLENRPLDWNPGARAEYFGTSLMGLRIEWMGAETERRWQGRVEHGGRVIQELWNLLDPLVPDPS